jgi:hypothetical protein
VAAEEEGMRKLSLELVEQPSRKKPPDPRFKGIIERVKTLGLGQALKVLPRRDVQTARTQLYTVAREEGVPVHILVKNRALYIWKARNLDGSEIKLEGAEPRRKG